MIISPRIQIAALVLAAIGASPPARADNKNEVRAVTFDEDSGVTRVHVRGAQTPTFTVYKLDRPARVVVDLPQARLGDALRGHDSAAVLTPSTWAVSTIAAQQLDDNAVRVIVTLARPGRYDVKTEGNELIVMVMPRDAAPKMASPEELEQAKQQARTAEAARAEAEKSTAAAKAQATQAQGEAERLRQVAADQAARAEAAQRAADEARAAQAKSATSVADLERAKATTAKAQADAARAKSDAAKASEQAQAAQAEADRMHAVVDQANQAKRDAAAETQKARDELARTQTDMTRLQRQADAAKQDAEHARRDADAKSAEADAAKRDAAKASAQSHNEAARAFAQADAAKQDAERARHEADAKAAEAAAAKRDAEAKQAEIDAKQRDLASKQTELASQRDELTSKQNELAAEKREFAKLSEQTRAEAEAAKADAAREKTAAVTARAEAEHAKADAARAKADADAEQAKAEKLITDAKQQLATIDTKTAHAQELEDHARATHAAAEAREEAAREAEAKAIHDRELAATEAKHAQDARDRAAVSDRAKLADEARAADERLAAAKRATADAEAHRIAAEQAAQAAKHDLDQTRTTLAAAEQQRAATEAAATEAARRRSDAEAAASDAVRRRGEAEAAAIEAAKKRSDSERAASAAEAARFAADKQRAVAEASAHAAETARTDAESSLAELTARRAAAEKAAAELDVRTRAEAKAQAEIAAAKARKAGDDELATARAEAARLADDRKRAETALADRRKSVALQQAEVGKLETAAAQAKDAADREEARRTKLAQQREDEEKQLAAVKQQLADVKAAAGHKAAPIVVADVPKPDSVPLANSPKPEVLPKAQVSDIRFRGDDSTAQVDLAIIGAADVHLGEVTADHVELIVDHAALAAKLERTLDVTRFGSPVRSVSSFRDRRNPNRVRLVVELAQAATSTVERDGTAVHWKFAGSHVPSPVIGGFGATSTPIAQESISQVAPQPGRRRIYHGATVDLDFKDAPLHDLLRVIADTGHVNLIVPDTIEAKVTVRLKRVPWDQALDEILASHGLWYRREGNIYRIATRKELDTEDEQEAARRKAAIEAEVPKPEIIRLNYASAAELKPKLETMLSPHGHLQVEERSNALIVTDVAGNREQIARLALQLDTQTPQITIEARIVEADSDYVRQIGVQWGGNALSGATGGNATGLIFPSSVALTGANEDNATKNAGVSLPSDFAVNIPAATGSGEGGAIGMSLGSVASNLNINLRLSALEDVGTVRIISAPKITVLNNKQAEIRQGVSIPISVVSAAGTQTQFVQADLKLTVTPYVSLRDCQIAMTLDVSKNEPDFVNVGARGDPTIVRKEAHTTMLVADGETSVLGGIYTRNSGLAYKKVPFFADLPFIGWLFKNRRENDNRTEVLVFITPKITNKASLTCTQ